MNEDIELPSKEGVRSIDDCLKKIPCAKIELARPHGKELLSRIIGTRQDLHSGEKALTEGKPCHISSENRMCGFDNRKVHIKFLFNKSQRMFRAVEGSQITRIL